METEQFIQYMRAASQDGVMVSGEQMNRLRRLAGEPTVGDWPDGWWGRVDPDGVQFLANKARRRG